MFTTLTKSTLSIILLAGLGLMTVAAQADGPDTGLRKRRTKTAAAKRAGWKETISNEQGFRVWLPGEPEVTNHQIKTPVGDIATTTYQLQQEGLSFNVAFNEYPSSPPAPLKVLEGVIDAWIKA